MTYLVSVCGSNAPTKEHEHLEDAKAEAERLSLMSNNKDRVIYVVQIVATMVPRTTHEWKGLK
jgi:3-deoxy-D-arabino-heptulosonate 7-phosphate (DAHP) synthase